MTAWALERIRNDVPVVVLDLYHYSSLGIFRSLGRLGVPVYGVHKDARSAAARSRYCRGVFEWDLAAPAPDTLAFLARMGRTFETRPVLVPTDDATAMLVAESRPELSDLFVVPEQPFGVVRELYRKQEFFHLCKAHGVPTPECAFPRGERDVVDFGRQAAFPVVVKAIEGARIRRAGGFPTAIVRDPGELLAAYRQMEDPQAPNLMLQEYIPGGEDSVWMFNGYFNARSECLFGITGHKIRQTPPYKGMTSLGICRANALVDELTRQFMKAIGYRGILDIGYRFDARDGRYKALDANPRVGATFRLFVSAEQLDVIRALYLDLTGQPVPATRAVEGRKWFVEDRDLNSFLKYRRDGRMTLREWLASFRGVQESAWFAGDDLRPFAAQARHFLAERASRMMDRMRGRPLET
jgi:predicted ATP-grasp superfamily ATP-dependent carboligase